MNATVQEREQPLNRERRSWLSHFAALAGAAMVAPGVHLLAITSAEGAADAKKRWGMLIDATRCDPHCARCVIACHEENGLPTPTRASDVRWIRKVALREKRSGREVSLPVMCLHCANPPCRDVCPTGATFKRKDGVVLVDRHICIGCRYCVMACPYKARNFVYAPVREQRNEVPRGAGCAEGCTLCVHRIDRGRLPACVEQCPNRALIFGDLNDPSSELVQRLQSISATILRADLRLDPAVRIHGV
ncbi:MAG: 4Fe-4S dicluster domain-containing protein [Hydrogenophilus sp.]|nr:4Fe-4S dicluster domain-containing protein [Hydrogenophilus sp.]